MSVCGFLFSPTDGDRRSLVPSSTILHKTSASRKNRFVYTFRRHVCVRAIDRVRVWCTAEDSDSALVSVCVVNENIG